VRKVTGSPGDQTRNRKKLKIKMTTSVRNACTIFRKTY
jgi:hypothetical protein